MSTEYFRHPPCDDMVPAALHVVGAVRDGDVADLLDAYSEARDVGGPAWTNALVVTLAAMVDVDRTEKQLLGWLLDTDSSDHHHLRTLCQTRSAP